MIQLRYAEVQVAKQLSDILDTPEKREAARAYLEERYTNEDGVPTWHGPQNNGGVPMAVLAVDGKQQAVSARRLFYYLELGHDLPGGRRYPLVAGSDQRALAPLEGVVVPSE